MILRCTTCNHRKTDVTVLAGTPSCTLSPIDAATVSITINGLSGSDTVNIGLAANSYGVTLTGNTTVGASGGTLTLSYNGTTTVTQTSPVSIGLTLNPGKYILSGSASVSLSIADGQASTRAIPVTQANIAAFNSYANTVAGRARHYKLAGNVTLTGSNNWTVIGPNTSTAFTGSFDGQGYTIKNLKISNTTSNYQGVFGVTGSGTVVKNLGLVDADITGNTYVGGVAGMNYGTIQNCSITGTVKGTESEVGGLVGMNYGFVQRCFSTANVQGKGTTGGIAGSNSAATILDCYTTGNVNSTTLGDTGGVVGLNTYGGLIQNCYATGSVSGDRGLAGGVVGYNNRTITRNTVALNTAVFVERGSIGRITSGLRQGLTHNYARYPMVIFSSEGGNKLTSSGLDSEDGANITQAKWNFAGWWTNAANWYTDNNNLAWDTSVWDIANSRLPILKNMPEGMQCAVVQ
jgi:hypothetical protein